MSSKGRYKFENKIYIYRVTRRTAQQELADLVGVSRQTIMLLTYSIAKVLA